MFERIYDILTQFLGESKQGSYDPSVTQYQFNCPHCAEENGGIPDGKYNMEVSFSKMLFQCWKCAESDGTKGTVGYLIRRFGTNLLYREYKEELTNLRKSSLYALDFMEDNPIMNTETFVSLPKTFSRIRLEHPLDKRLLSYLEKRRITQDIIDRYGLGYTGWENDNPRWSNRLIIPSYDSFGDINYWTGRDFTGRAFQKYCNCDADKKDIVFQESLIDWDANVILVEGAIDCIYYHNAIALLGKSLREDSAVFQALMGRCNGEVIICLDADTQERETQKIYKMLDKGRLRGHVRYISMADDSIPYKDFGEAYEGEGKRGIIELLRKKKTYTEKDLIW